MTIEKWWVLVLFAWGVVAYAAAATPVKELLIPSSAQRVCAKHPGGISCRPAAEVEHYILSNAPDDSGRCP